MLGHATTRDTGTRPYRCASNCSNSVDAGLSGADDSGADDRNRTRVFSLGSRFGARLTVHRVKSRGVVYDVVV
jgi:hypothetical protein